MDSIKISLHLFLAFLSFYNSECRTLPKYNIPDDQVSDFNEKNSCFCFANPGKFSKVPDILQPHSGELERLIVYLYKDKDTNDVKMYIPNEEKQSLVPDLAFEVGDKLVTVGDKSVNDIFNVNSGNIPMNSDPFALQHELPLEYLHGFSDATSDSSFEKHGKPHSQHHSHSHETPDDAKFLDQPGRLLPQQPHQKSEINLVPTSESIGPSQPPITVKEDYAVPNIEVFPLDPKTIEKTQIDNQIYWEIPSKDEFIRGSEEESVGKAITHDSPYESKSGSYHPIEGIESSEEFDMDNGASKSGKSGGQQSEKESISTENEPEIIISDEDNNAAALDTIFTIQPSQNSESSGQSKPKEQVDSSSIQFIDESDLTDSIDYSVKDASDDIQFPEDISVNVKRKPSQENKSQVSSFSIEEIVSPVADHNQNNYETFDRWFIRQMLRFKVYKEHDSAVNISTIERYILKILQDNDMLVTSEGVLTDLYGTALDVQNLHLRPILIGNSMAIKNILNEKDQELVLPVDLPYLQAILVTTANPSMILGIIPIGKTIIPPSAINAFSTILKKSNAPVQKTSNILVDGKLNLDKRYLKGLVKDTKPMVVHITGSNLGPEVTVKKNNGGRSNTMFTVVKETPLIVHNHPAHRPSETVTFDSENNEISLGGKTIDAVKKLLNVFSIGNDNLDQESVVIENNADDDEDDIAERIVGGSAATGSGTPLSIKGRMKDF